jgi:hypothetical protein
MFEKWYVVILIELLPPLIPPCKGGKYPILPLGKGELEGVKRTCVYTVALARGGLGWGKKIFDTSIITFQTSSKLCDDKY